MRRRRLIAALLLCAAAAIAVQQLTPAGPVTTEVLVAARDLPAGHVLSADDLKSADVSPLMVPDGSLRPAGATAIPGTAATAASAVTAGIGATAGSGQDSVQQPAVASDPAPLWLGRQLSGPKRRGEVMTDAALLGEELLVGAPPGSQAVPLRLTDASTVQLLRQGQLVNVVLSVSIGLDGPSSNEVIASSVPVLWTPQLATTSSSLLPSQDNDGLVVVAATPEQATVLAGASARGKIFLVMVS